VISSFVLDVIRCCVIAVYPMVGGAFCRGLVIIRAVYTPFGVIVLSFESVLKIRRFW
jgi:hypothetical protein